MASFASFATTCGARKHAWTKILCLRMFGLWCLKEKYSKCRNGYETIQENVPNCTKQQMPPHINGAWTNRAVGKFKGSRQKLGQRHRL